MSERCIWKNSSKKGHGIDIWPSTQYYSVMLLQSPKHRPAVWSHRSSSRLEEKVSAEQCRHKTAVITPRSISPPWMCWCCNTAPPDPLPLSGSFLIQRLPRPWLLEDSPKTAQIRMGGMAETKPLETDPVHLKETGNNAFKAGQLRGGAFSCTL